MGNISNLRTCVERGVVEKLYVSIVLMLHQYWPGRMAYVRDRAFPFLFLFSLSLYLPSPSLFLDLLPPVRRLLDRCTSVYVSVRISVSLCFFLSFFLFSFFFASSHPSPPPIIFTRCPAEKKKKNEETDWQGNLRLWGGKLINRILRDIKD